MATQLGAFVIKMNTPGSKKQVVICETQPVTAEGIRAALSGCEDLEYQCGLDSLGAATEHLKKGAPDLLLIDKSFGAQAVLHWLNEQRPQLVGVGPDHLGFGHHRAGGATAAATGGEGDPAQVGRDGHIGGLPQGGGGRRQLDGRRAVPRCAAQ